MSDTDLYTFATKPLDHNGGEVTLYGVYVMFPPGALRDPVDITLSILSDPECLPKMDNNTALLSPVVFLEPHGLQLQKPVELGIPHCAIAKYGDDIQRAWTFTILKTETLLGEAVNWQEANGAGDTVLEITERYIRLNLQHFTGETAVGQPKGTEAQKAVQLLFYSKAQHKLGHKYMVAFDCVDDTLRQVWQTIGILLQYGSSMIMVVRWGQCFALPKRGCLGA